jgi:hypothetical protein
MIAKKNTQGEILDLNLFDLGWLVGMIEGEGSVNSHINEKSGYLCTSLSIASTDKDIINRLNSLFPGASRQYKREYNNHYKTQYLWSINKRKDIRTISKTIFPYLSERRKTQFGKVINMINEYEK